MHHITVVWTALRASFWFVPYLIVSIFVATAIELTHLRPGTARLWLDAFPQLFNVSAAGARDMLATIASCMISVVGIVFSMTLVALALASSQYSSRVVRNFMRSRLTQLSIGVFAGLYAYCLIVLRGIRGREDDLVVPVTAVTLAIIAAIAAVGLLIFFIHHIAMSIQAATILSSIAAETIHTIEQMYPRRDSNATERMTALHASTDAHCKGGREVRAAHSGYIQSIDEDALLKFACQHDVLVCMLKGVGSFIVADACLLTVTQGPDLCERLVQELRNMIVVRSYRTVEQDPSFGIRQIVDVSLKALSPGINDTTTAVMGLDYLGTILASLIPRSIPMPDRSIAGQLRLRTAQPNFSTLTHEAFDQIRRSAASNVAVILHIATTIEMLSTFPITAEHEAPLGEQLNALDELTRRTVQAADDRGVILDRIAFTSRAFAATLAYAG